MMVCHLRLRPIAFCALAALSVTGFAQQQSGNNEPANQPWMNTTLPINQRVDDLIG